jgi:spore maturation protein CgeB
MKILLLSPDSYTLDKTFKSGLEILNHQVYHYNFQSSVSSWKEKLNSQAYRVPFRFREKWEQYYMNEINRKHLEKYEEIRPDLVFIYNNEMLLPSTVEHFKKKSKIIFFLGDNPYYTPTNNYYLRLLESADLIVSPDSFWIEQLQLTGIKNLIFEIFGFNDEVNYIVEPSPEELEKFGTDVLFIGAGYADSWGYKRARFLNCFSEFKLTIYGDRHWLRWIEFFPELRNSFNLLKQRISFEQMNLFCNCAKFYPVDANPGVLNGLHVRVFDCIGSGILPLVEYRKDIMTVFKDVEIPVIHSYNDASEIARKYIINEELRRKTLACLRDYAFEQYNPVSVFRRILSHL